MPFQQRVLDITPLLNSLRTSRGQRRATTPGKKKTAKDSGLVEGRIGAVNQYYEEVDHYMNQMRANMEMWGPVTGMEQTSYKVAAAGLDQATSPQKKNIIKEQTKDLNRYKESVKGKGAFFHLEEAFSTMGKDVRNHDELIQQQAEGWFT